jgi:hypothetical protein
LLPNVFRVDGNAQALFGFIATHVLLAKDGVFVSNVIAVRQDNNRPVLRLKRGPFLRLPRALIAGRDALASRTFLASLDLGLALFAESFSVRVATCVARVANSMFLADAPYTKSPGLAHRNNVDRGISASVFVVLMPVDMVVLIFVGNERQIVDSLPTVQFR